MTVFFSDFSRKTVGFKFNIKNFASLSLVLIKVVLEVFLNTNLIEPLEPSFFLSVKKNCSDGGNVYHRKLLERSLTVAV